MTSDADPARADLLHGGALDRVARRFPQACAPWIDLSTGVSPIVYPLSPAPVDALRALPSRTLEDAARGAAAHAFGAPGAHVRLTPGSSAAIAALARLPELRSAAIVSPTYGEHARAFAAAGKRVRASPGPETAAPEDALILVNPNNPDGRAWPRGTVLEMAERRSAAGLWTIVDEAFADFFPALSVAGAVRDSLNLVVIRSFGKAYGLAGLRLGAVIAPAHVLASLEDALGPWPVSAPALLAAREAYPDQAWRDRTRTELETRRDRLAGVIETAGLAIEGEALLFVTARIAGAHRVWTSLCEAGVYVRRFDEDRERLRFGLPADESGLERLAAALEGS